MTHRERAQWWLESQLPIRHEPHTYEIDSLEAEFAAAWREGWNAGRAGEPPSTAGEPQ
jgi:hypothetical protein